MNNHLNINQAIKEIEDINSNNQHTPFSNGSEGMSWLSNNCNNCVRCYETRNELKEPLQHHQTTKLVREHKECIGFLAMGYGFITGSIPKVIAESIGGTCKTQEKPFGRFTSLPSKCKHFSDDDKDNPDVNPIVPIAPNQIKLPFDLMDYLRDMEGVVVTKKAIYESV